MTSFKRFAFTLVCSFLLVQAVFANSEKGLKALDKKEYDKAYTYFTEALNKNPDDILASYGMGRLLSLRDFGQYDIEKAYLFVINAKEAYKQLDEKAKKKLNKVNVQEPIILSLQEFIDSVAYENTIQAKSTEALDEFIKIHKTSPNLGKAIALKGHLEYLKVQKANTYQAYASYLKKYPGSEKEPEIKKKYDELYFKAIKKKGTLEAYRDYLAQYPDTPYLNEVKEKIELLEFKALVKENTIEAYEAYLQNYPNTKFKKAVDDSIFARFTSFPSIGEYEKFIRKYPNNYHVRDAWEKIYVLFNDYGDPETFEAFKARFPDYFEKHQLENDIELANFGLKMLNTNFEGFKQEQVDAYITLAAPTELSITVLKKRLKPLLDANEYQKAIDLLRKFQPYYKHKSFRIASWIDTLKKAKESYQANNNKPQFTLN